MGHNRDRRDKDRRDYIPFHIHSDTEPKTKDKDRDHISSDTEGGSGDKMGDIHDILEGKGKGP